MVKLWLTLNNNCLICKWRTYHKHHRMGFYTRHIYKLVVQMGNHDLRSTQHGTQLVDFRNNSTKQRNSMTKSRVLFELFKIQLPLDIRKRHDDSRLGHIQRLHRIVSRIVGICSLDNIVGFHNRSQIHIWNARKYSHSMI